MATTADRLLRDHVRYTGDGQPNAPTGAPLPGGDPTSGVFNPSKKDLRDAINSVVGSAEAANEAAERANDAADLVENFLTNLPPIVMICAGQSNMRSTVNQTGGDLTPNDNVYFWNSQAAPMADGTAWVRGEIGSNPFIGTAGVNNLAFQAAKEMQRRTGRPIYVILVALGGHHIEAFMNPVDLANNGWARTSGEAALFEFMLAQAALALPLIPGAPTTVDYFFWHQGEANRTEQPELYANKLRWLLRRLETNGLITKNHTDVVAGELAVTNSSQNGIYRERHYNALRRLQIGTRNDAFPRFKIARSIGLLSVAGDDQLHFAGPDLTALAKRYVDATFATQEYMSHDFLTCDMSVNGSLGWSTNIVAAQSTAINDDQRREPVYLADVPLGVAYNGTAMGWSYVSTADQAVICSRMTKEVDPYSQLLIPILVRNIGSNPGVFGVGILEYGSTGIYNQLNLMSQQTINPGEQVYHYATFGLASNGRTNHRDITAGTYRIGLHYRFNPGGGGSPLEIHFQNPKFI